MKTRVVTLLATMLLLTFCGLTTMPRWFESQARSRVSQTRLLQRTAATALRASIEKGGLPLRTVVDTPEGVPWTDMLDPFFNKEKKPIRYFAGAGNSWILAGSGPDEDDDFKPADWAFAKEAAHDERWLALSYDPTNGTISNGDVLMASWEPPPESHRKSRSR